MVIRNPFIINPITMWFRSLLSYVITKWSNPTIRIQHNVSISRTMFGQYVTLNNDTKLIDCNIGDYSYLGSSCSIISTHIGKFCSIGTGVKCGAGMHPTNFVSIHPIFYSLRRQAQITFAKRQCFEEYQPVEIGNDVWVGSNAFISGGVRIGDGAIIAAGAIVTRDVPDYAIVAGIPAKLVRYRFTHQQIDFLLKFKWWDRPVDWMRKNWELWHDIDKFIKLNS